MDANTLGVPLAIAAAVVILPAAIHYIIKGGLFQTPKVKDGTPPVRELTIMYKVGYGSYSLVTNVFKELTALAPDVDAVGLYYDDPTKIPAESLRWAVGTVLAEGTEDVDVVLEERLRAAGFRRHQLPCADRAVQATWDFSSLLGMYLVNTRVYPALVEYMMAHSIREKAGMVMEYYKNRVVTILFLMDHHDGFYVPEIKAKRT